MKPSETNIVTPPPYYMIRFRCSNRQFYQVKSDLYDLGESIGIEPGDGYISDECDYEGDLQNLIVYREERSQSFVQAILEKYAIKEDIPVDMNIHLTCQ